MGWVGIWDGVGVRAKARVGVGVGGLGRVEARVRSTPRPTLLPRRTPAVSRKTYSLPSRLSVWC